MSNKITLATIQFRADAKGVNPTLDAMRQSSKDAHDEIDRLQQSLDRGIKTMKDVNGVDFKVADKIKEMTKLANGYDSAVRELMKGATALESVVKNIELGTIEKNSRAELKGAINAANSRLRSIRQMEEDGTASEEDLQRQRELNIVILESQKQLNNLDRDTKKVIETIEQGGAISEAVLNKEMKGLKDMLALIPKGTDEWNQYNAQLQQIEQHVASIRKQEREAASTLLSSQNLGGFSEEQIRAAINSGKELLATYKTASPEAKTLADNIVRAEQYLKNYGVEAARAAAREQEQLQLEQELAKTMNKRLRDLKNLSADALAETRRYWEAQKNGAAQGTEEFNKAEAALKKINGYMSRTRRDELKNILGSPENYSITEVKNAVQEVEKLRDSVQRGIPVWHQYNNLLTQGKQYLDNLAKSEAAERIKKQMTDLKSLSAAGLQEVKKYWETMVAGAAHGSNELKQYEANLQKVIKEEKDRAASQSRYDSLFIFADKENFSEGELRKMIDAAKEYQRTLKIGTKEYDDYSRAIVETEEYLKRYGVEAERTKMSIKEMQDQLAKGTSLTDSALKAQENYWRRMAENPKATNEEMRQYIANMKEAQQLQTDLAFKRGKDTLEKAQRGEYNTANMTDLSKAINEIKAYQALIRDPNGLGKETFDATKVQIDALSAQLNKLKGVAESTKTTFASVNEVIARFGEHMKSGKNASEGMASTFDEKLNAETSEYDKSIQNCVEALDFWEEELKESEGRVSRLEAEYDRLVKLMNSDNPFKRLQGEMQGGWKRAHNIWSRIEGDGTEDNQGWKTAVEDAKSNIRNWKENLEYWKQKKAEALGLNEAEEQLVQTEEKLQQTRRMTKEEMQEGIKMLEAEAFAQDRNTSEGKARFEELQQVISQMNEEIEVASGKMMDFADAEKIANDAMAEQAKTEKTGWAAGTEELKRAEQALTNKIAKAKRGTAEEEAAYQKLVKQLQAVRTEMQGGAVTGQKMMAILKDPKSITNIDTLKTAVGRARMELNALGERIDQAKADKNKKQVKELQKTYDELAKSIKTTDQHMKELQNTTKGSASAFDKAWSRLKTYITLYMGAAVAIQKLTATLGDVAELSDKMGEVQKTTGFTADEVGRLSENLKKMDVRTPLTQLMELSASAGQLGLKTLEDVQGFTEAANKLMIALPEMGKEAATEMMRVAIATGEVKKIEKQLQEGTIEGSSATAVAMEKIASTIDRLRASSASTAPEITDFVKRVGAVGAQSGITIDQVAALGSTISSLGMRVEMSATALSRMIPAIKNNAFEVARAIGMVPEELRAMFDKAGGGMEAILAIFQHMKDQGMDEESIEKALGMGGMQEVMKELNQQGARAGIVFAGLSQNVEELRRQLLVANTAYEQNIAIQQEFDKMNETTAARWERLKNEVEEMFVGDRPQRWLGNIIDFLRGIVNLLSGDNGISAFLRSFLVYLGLVRIQLVSIAAGALKAVGGGLKNIGIMLGFIRGEMTKLQWGNIFTALVGALIWVYTEFSNLKSAMEKAKESLAKTQEEVERAKNRFEGYWQKLKDTSAALDQARASHDKLSAEVDKLRGSTDKGAASTENLKKKEDELKKSEDAVTKASNEHKAAIMNMNSIYGKYLGFMLTETNYANLAAVAHDKVAAAIEREMLAKQKQAAISDVDSNYSDQITSNYAKLSERLTSKGLDRSQSSQAMSDLQKFLRENTSYDVAKNQTVVSKAVTDKLKKTGLDLSKATANEIVALWYDEYLKNTYHLDEKTRSIITGVERRSDLSEGWGNVYSPFGTNVRGGYAETYVQRERERGAVSTVYDVDLNRVAGKEAESAGKLLTKLEKQAQDAKQTILDKKTSDEDRNKAYTELANALEGLDNRINELNPQKDAETINRLRDMAKSLSGEGINVKKLTAARREIHSTLFERATFDENSFNNIRDNNPWGSNQPADSTNYKDMAADALVNRRKQMKEFVNSIQTDSDVQAVLSEDKALKKAIENGMASDMRTVIEWYNTERLKIQDELHARHLTNTGDWMDPKKQKNRHKQFKAEMQAYLEELDAYYTERNQKIQEARNEEEITEGDAWRQTIENESEWHQRRAELQKLYADKSAEVTSDEQKAIFDIIAERTGDEADFIRKSVEKTKQFAEQVRKADERGEAEYRKWMADLGLGWEKDYLKQAKSIGKQVKFMTDTLAKERPFNGIAENLQENLTKMGIMVGDVPEKMHFLLGQIESAYTMDVKEMVKRISDAGFKEWAKQIEGDTQVQQALLGQLRLAYEQVQEAIRKEASRIKKDADMMWKLTLMPDGTNLKQAADEALARMGLQQESIGRANSLIGAGVASDNVASKLAIKQLQLQLSMQRAQFALMRKMGNEKAQYLDNLAKQYDLEKDSAKAERARIDAANVRKSLELAVTEETKKQQELNSQIAKEQEEAQNRLYKELREWGELLASSLQSVFEASNAGNAEYYNELAKLNLTGKGGPGAGTYIVIDNEGTEDAKAHYEYLDERAALERQREIEQQNAQADAWKKVMDDLNQKMNDLITDQLNAMLQNTSIDANTSELVSNTQAMTSLTGAVNTLAGTMSAKAATEDAYKPGGNGKTINGGNMGVDENGVPIALQEPEQKEEAPGYGASWVQPQAEQTEGQPGWYVPLAMPEEEQNPFAKYAEWSNAATDTILNNQQKVKQGEQQTDKSLVSSSQATFAKMALAANLYGVAYQAMSNENLSTTQKFEMIALQSVGNFAISSLTAFMAEAVAKGAVNEATVLGKLWSQLGWAAAPVFAIFTGLLGAAMGAATSAVSKSKSQISQVTGSSVSAGRLATGMMTYAEGNVNELTDPSTLTPGRHYNVDGADGRTYRAKYMGKDARTHITTGPEFHLVGEKGREAIIDAHTTRNIQTNDPEIWRTIQTLYNGGSMSRVRSRRGRGVKAFAEGNLDDFEEIGSEMGTGEGADTGMIMGQMAAFQQSLDRNSAIMERLADEGIEAFVSPYGKRGIVNGYDTYKKEAQRHGERY